MGDIAVATQRGKDLRIFHPRDSIGAVAEQAPALLQPRQQVRSVLKPGTADNSDGNLLPGEALQCAGEVVLAETSREPRSEPRVGLRRRDGVLVAEKIRHQR